MSTATSLPGPHLDLVPELIRWFRRWLVDDPNGIEDDPPIQVFVRRPTRPEPDLAEHRGDWRHEPGWPLARSTGARAGASTAATAARSRSSATSAPPRGSPVRAGCPWGQPLDQREDDARSLCFDWELARRAPRSSGHPARRGDARVDVPVAYLAARLCNVFPDGTSALVTRGLLNLSQRALGSTARAARARRAGEAQARARSDLVGVRGRAEAPACARRLRVAERLAAATRRDAQRSSEVRLDASRRRRAARRSPIHRSSRRRPAPRHTARPRTRRRASDRVARRAATCSPARRAASSLTASTTTGTSAPRSRSATRARSGSRPSIRGAPGPTASASYRIRWPEADVITEARLDLRSDADAYHVVIERRRRGSSIGPFGRDGSAASSGRIPRKLDLSSGHGVTGGEVPGNGVRRPPRAPDRRRCNARGSRAAPPRPRRRAGNGDGSGTPSGSASDRASRPTRICCSISSASGTTESKRPRVGVARDWRGDPRSDRARRSGRGTSPRSGRRCSRQGRGRG